MVRALLRIGSCGALAAWPCAALAHSPLPQIGQFYTGLVHPLIAPGHALVLVGLSLLLGQQGDSAARIGLPILWSAFALGLGAATAFAAPVNPEPALLLIAVVIGAAAAAAIPIPRVAVGAASLSAGLALGLDSAPDPADARGRLLQTLGLLSGIALASTIIAGNGLTVTTTWGRLGIRIVGSWIAAAALLALALALHAASR